MKSVFMIAAILLLATPANANPFKSVVKASHRAVHAAASAGKALVDLGKAEVSFTKVALLSQAELVLLDIHDFNSRNAR